MRNSPLRSQAAAPPRGGKTGQRSATRLAEGKWHLVPILTVVRPRSLASQTRKRRGTLTVRVAARQAKVSPSTFNRVENGYSPDVATFVKLSRWILTDDH
jgi:hypothetical protein